MNEKAINAYNWLRRDSVETAYLESMGSLVAWDQRTYLPTGGHGHRAETLATLSRLIHERAIGPIIVNAVEIALE